MTEIHPTYNCVLKIPFLAYSKHRFEVRARNLMTGAVDDTPAFYEWEIAHCNNDQLKYAEIGKIDLRDTKTLKEIEKLKDIEHLVLANMKYIKDWSPLLKLKKGTVKWLKLKGNRTF